MGNCVAKQTLIAEDEKKVINTANAPKMESCRKEKGKTVRIRLVLTQSELNQILNGELPQNCSSFSSSSSLQLLSALQIKSRRNAEGGFKDWRPDLETIPEDY